MSSDRQDRDGVPLPAGPLEEPAGGEVVSLRPSAGRVRRPVLPAAELAVSSFGEVAARVAAGGEPRWLIQGLCPADAYGVLAAQETAAGSRSGGGEQGQRGSVIGLRYRWTTPEMEARVVAAVEQRLAVALKIAGGWASLAP
jgi:hypothetical protein